MNWISNLTDVGRDKSAVEVVSLALGVGGVVNTIVQTLRAAPRFFRYRPLRQFFRFRNGQRVLIVCSELENPEGRQWVEPHEFIYMLKYGDLDALFEIASTIREVYPRCRLRILSSREAASGSVDFSCDLIFIGGPDYNETAAKFMREAGASLGYLELDCENPQQSPIALQHLGVDQRWRGTNREEDYGYIEVVAHPFARGARIFLFGGCHTIGVTGAVKALQLKREDEPGLTGQAADNLKRLVRCGLLRRQFAVVFRVALVGATVPSPSLEHGEFFGSPRRILGMEVDWVFRLARELTSSGLEGPKSGAAPDLNSAV